MTDNLIGPKPDGPTFPTPWQADFDRILDADDEVVFYLGHVDQPLLIGIVDAVSAYYDVAPEGKSKARVQRDYWRQQAETKDTRIVALEGRAQVAEELVKKLQKEAGKRNERWAIMVREVDKRDARIADLERKLKRAHDTMSDLHRDKDDAEKRAEAAEARVNLFQWCHQEDLDEIAALGKRAKKAETRANYVVADRDRVEDRKVEALERAEDAEARVRELEAKNARLERALRDEISKEARQVFGVDDAPDTFAAPDGRVFRVGQRVKDSMKPERIGTIRRFHPLSQGGQTPVVIRMDDGSKPHYNPEFLRRVWDGSEEPDVPVGTVLRDADGDYWYKKDTGWDCGCDGACCPGQPWGDRGPMTEHGPYVEHLPGDDK